MARKKRMIDANPVINGIGDYVTTNAYLNDTALDALGMVEKWLEEAPTVDAVEVVRCGKCKRYDRELGVCEFWHGKRNPGHFCKEGEQR